MKLNERDMEVLRVLYRYRVMYGRNLWRIVGFKGENYGIRRVKKMIDEGLVEKEKILKDVPMVYLITKRGMDLLDIPVRARKIDIDKLRHELAIGDIAVYVMKRYPDAVIKTEREMKAADFKSFGKAMYHRPDLTAEWQGQRIAVEYERTQKSMKRIERNIIQNFNDYQKCIWIIPEYRRNLRRIFKEYATTRKLPVDCFEVLTFEKLNREEYQQVEMEQEKSEPTTADMISTEKIGVDYWLKKIKGEKKNGL